MTRIRRNPMSWQSSLGAEPVATQLISLSLLLISTLLALLGLIQQQGVPLGLAAIGLFAALSLRQSDRCRTDRGSPEGAPGNFSRTRQPSAG